MREFEFNMSQKISVLDTSIKGVVVARSQHYGSSNQ